MNRIVAAASFAVGALMATGAQAFNCSLPEGPKAPFYLYAKPDEKSKVLAVMPAGGHIKLPPGKIREKGGRLDGTIHWTYVIWTPEDPKAKSRRGWIDRSKTHGGECED